MNITELKNDKIDFHVKVTISASKINSEIEKELARIAKTARIDGFRAGKVPVSVVKKKYEKSIRADIIRNNVNDSVDKIIQEKNLRIALDPKLDNLVNGDNEDLEFTLKFQLIPEISIPDFKKITIEKPILEVTEKETKEQLDKLVEFSKEYTKKTKGKAKKGDEVTIDTIGYVKGKAFEGGTLKQHKLVLGSNAFIPGFEDQLIGAKAGEEVVVKLEFPKEYHAEDLAGKVAEFKVHVNRVHQPVYPEINDAFAKKFNCENIEKLQEQIATNIKNTYEDPIRTLMKMKLFDQLEEMLTFEVPNSLLQKEKELLIKQASQQNSEDQGIISKNAEEQSKNYKKIALRRVRIGLLLAEYVKVKKLQIQEQDIRKAVISQARNYPGQEHQVIEFYKKDKKALESLKGPVLEEKAVQNIFCQEIKLKEKIYTKDKLEKLLEKENI